jgi:hypothetical protein
MWGADNNILWLKGIIFSMTMTVRYLGEARKGIGKTPDPSLELGFADLTREELVRKPSAASLPERMKGVLRKA